MTVFSRSTYRARRSSVCNRSSPKLATGLRGFVFYPTDGEGMNEYNNLEKGREGAVKPVTGLSWGPGVLGAIASTLVVLNGPVVQSQEPPQLSQEEASSQVLIQRIEIRGSSRFSAEELWAIAAPYEGQELSLQDLQRLADELTQLYLNQDYLTSRAIVPQQDIVDGVVVIEVIEGRLTEIEIEGNERLQDSFLRDRLQRAAGVPLNTARLEDELRLLRADPLFDQISANLRSGDALGESRLRVQVREANPIQLSISSDNYSPPSIGGERLNLGFSHRNLAGVGDRLSVDYNLTYGDGLDFIDIGYEIPVNSRDGRLRLRVAPTRNEVTQAPFDQLDIRGESSLYELSYRHPLQRTPREEFALSLGFAWQDSQTFFLDRSQAFGIGPDESGRSRTRVITFGQDYIHRQVDGAWMLQSQLRFGTGLFNATNNSGDIPDGQFFSWGLQGQRVQRLHRDHLLVVRLAAQFSPDPLLPSQQFVMGGGQSLRGYRQNVRAGDNGLRFSVEDRITLLRNAAGQSRLQVLPFVDLGVVWNHSNNPNPQARQQFLASLGLGAIWEPSPGFTLRVDYGLPLVDLDDRGRNIQDDGFHFRVGYEF